MLSRTNERAGARLGFGRRTRLRPAGRSTPATWAPAVGRAGDPAEPGAGPVGEDDRAATATGSDAAHDDGAIGNALMAAVPSARGLIIVAGAPASRRAAVLADVAARAGGDGALYLLSNPAVVPCHPGMRLAEIAARCAFDRRVSQALAMTAVDAARPVPPDLATAARTGRSAVVVLDHGEALAPDVLMQLRRWQSAFQSVRGRVAIIIGVDGDAEALPNGVDAVRDTLITLPPTAPERRPAAIMPPAGAAGPSPVRHHRRWAGPGAVGMTALAIALAAYVAGVFPPELPSPPPSGPVTADQPAAAVSAPVAVGNGGGGGEPQASLPLPPPPGDQPGHRASDAHVVPAVAFPATPPAGSTIEAGTGAATIIPVTFSGDAVLAQAPGEAASEPAPAEVHPGGTAPAADAPSVEPAATSVPAPDPAAVAALLERGNAMLDRGDVASARLFFRRAAEAGSPEGALLMGASFDPLTFRRLGIRGIRPDVAEAIAWYQVALERGGTDADSRLASIRRWLEGRARDGDPQARQLLDSFR